MSEEEAKKLVSIEVIPVQSYILNGVKAIVPLLFQINVGFREDKDTKVVDRPNFDLCIVLDCYKEMSNENQTILKSATNTILEQLTPDDTFSLLVVNELKVEELFKGRRLYDNEKLNMQDQISQLTSEASNNDTLHLVEGLLAGAEILQKINPESQSLKRLFLISDGSNKDITASGEIYDLASSLASRGISINSIGVGEHVGEVIKKTPRNGRFFHVPNIESVSDLSKGLFSYPVGVESCLKFRGLRGSELHSIFEQPKESLVSGTLLGELREGDIKKVLVYVDVKSNNFNEENMDKKQSEEGTILYYSFSFNLLSNGANNNNNNNNNNSIPISITGRVNGKFTDDDSLISNPFDDQKEVYCEVVKMECQSDYDKARYLFADMRNTEAFSLKKTTLDKLEKIKNVDQEAANLYHLTQLLQPLGGSQQNVTNVTSGTFYTEEDDEEMDFGLFD